MFLFSPHQFVDIINSLRLILSQNNLLKLEQGLHIYLGKTKAIDF